MSQLGLGDEAIYVLVTDISNEKIICENVGFTDTHFTQSAMTAHNKRALPHKQLTPSLYNGVCYELPANRHLIDKPQACFLPG